MILTDVYYTRQNVDYPGRSLDYFGCNLDLLGGDVDYLSNGQHIGQFKLAVVARTAWENGYKFVTHQKSQYLVACCPSYCHNLGDFIFESA